jgi:hypothetical protein
MYGLAAYGCVGYGEGWRRTPTVATAELASIDASVVLRGARAVARVVDADALVRSRGAAAVVIGAQVLAS